MLVEHYKDDLPAAEALLREVAANPKLDKASVGALYVDYELGNLYDVTSRPEKAAACFARVVLALDDKANAKLSNADLARFLGDDAAAAYHRFGRVFFGAGKVDLAIRAFLRGLVYDPDDPALILAITEAYDVAGKPAEALVYLEKFIDRQPSGRESYDLLAKILVSLKRDKEIIPGSRSTPRRTPRTSRSSTPWPTATSSPASPRRPGRSTTASSPSSATRRPSPTSSPSSSRSGRPRSS